MGSRLSQKKAERPVFQDCETGNGSLDFRVLFPPETRHADPHTLQSLDSRLTAVFPQLLRLGNTHLPVCFPTLARCCSWSCLCWSPASLYTISECVKFHPNLRHMAHPAPSYTYSFLSFPLWSSEPKAQSVAPCWASGFSFGLGLRWRYLLVLWDTWEY